MERISRWLVFGAVFSVLPLYNAWNDAHFIARDTSWVEVVKNGELLVIIWVLALSACGELFCAGGNPVLKILIGGSTLVVIIVAAHAFATVNTTKELLSTMANEKPSEHVDKVFVAYFSARLFFFSLVPCVACIAVT